MNSAEMGRSYKRQKGVAGKGRTVRRHEKDAVDALQATAAGPIQQAPGYCRELVDIVPGSVAARGEYTTNLAFVLGVCSIRGGFDRRSCVCM